MRPPQALSALLFLYMDVLALPPPWLTVKLVTASLVTSGVCRLVTASLVTGPQTQPSSPRSSRALIPPTPRPAQAVPPGAKQRNRECSREEHDLQLQRVAARLVELEQLAHVREPHGDDHVDHDD